MPDASAPPSPRPAAPSGRLGWLDANRFFAALGVIMIHCSADAEGNGFHAYPVGERIVPVFARLLGELSGAELFLFVAMFVLAMRMDRPNAPGYGAIVRNQANRLLVPFAIWSVFYLAFRFVKGGAFGYTASLLTEIGDWHSWVRYVLMGSAQYHLHFLPTLFVMVLFYPAMLAALRFPLLGLVFLPLMYCMDTLQNWIWGHVTDAFVRDLLDRAVKDVCYTGYGFAAFGIFAVWRKGLSAHDGALLRRFSACIAAIAFVTTFAYGGEVVLSGYWVVRPGAAFYAHLAMPMLIFTLFMSAQTAAWPVIYSDLAKLTYGIFLIHPVFIDCYDIALAKTGLTLDPSVLVFSKYILVVLLATGATWLMSKVPPLAWSVGILPEKRAGSVARGVSGPARV